jgi:poly(3-hydroxybutyrate) depolymerase
MATKAIQQVLMTIMLGLICTFYMSSCMVAQSKTDNSIGKTINEKINIDGIEREFILYIPQSSNHLSKVPLVFMLHGSSGTGKKFYNISGWNKLADQEGFIVCYPTALEYPVVKQKANNPDDYKIRMSTKWASPSIIDDLKPGTELIDEVPFFRLMIKTISLKMEIIDKSRIYVAGFSNGGGLIKTTLMDEMSDVFAAFGTSGGLMPIELSYKAPDQISVYMLVGMRDDRVFSQTLLDENISINPNALLNEPHIADQLKNALASLEMQDYEFAQKTKINQYATLKYKDKVNDQERFGISFVQGMTHCYPNEKNNPAKFSGAEAHWRFFKDKRL